MKQAILCAFLTCAGLLPARADFSYQQTTKITGGAMQAMVRMAGAFSKQAREPMVSTVAVSGHRMSHINAHTAQIIDVDKETITDINFDKKTYSVLTFAQMKQAMEDMMNKMQQSKNENKADIQFKASVKETGQSKTIEGVNAKEVLLTLTMEGTDKQTGNAGSMDTSADMWVAPVAGYDEVLRFYRLYAAKIGMMPGQNMGLFAARPEMMKAMADLGKEMSKMEGTPIETIVKIGGSGTGVAQGSTAGQQQQPPPPSARDLAAGAALGRLGLGGFGRKKKNEDQQQQQQTASGDSQSSSGSLIEMTTDTSGFSTQSVDPSKFQVPSGFKQVDSDMLRHSR